MFLIKISLKYSLLFTINIFSKQPLPIEKMEALDKYYGFGTTRNCEVLFNWLRLGIKARWESIIEPALKFVSQQGRMKYTRPIYR
jgi:leukotriene-A4 hydrolase